MTKFCKFCNKELNKKQKFFCSFICRCKSQIGKSSNSSTIFKKGHITWNKGKRWDAMKGENSPHWKENIGYIGIHAWVVRESGKPQFCESCGTEQAVKFEWANISGEYKRDLTDWIRLCKKCHHKFDNISNKRWKNHIYNINKSCLLCTKIVKARNLCDAHYSKNRRYINVSTYFGL